MIDYNCCRESMNPFLIPQLLKFRIDFRREHPDYFDPDGLVMFGAYFLYTVFFRRR